MREARRFAPPEDEWFGDPSILDGVELGPVVIPPAEFGEGLEGTVADEPQVITLLAGNDKPTQVTIDGTTEDLTKAVTRIGKLKRLRNSSVLVRADASIEHKEVVKVLDALQRIGAVKISIAITDRSPGEVTPPEEPGPPDEK